MIEMIDGSKLVAILTGVVLSCVRFGIVIHTLPIFAETTLPVLLRNGIVIALLLPFYPCIIPQHIPVFASPLFFLFIALKEALIGLCISFVVSIVFWAASNAGHLIDMVRGAGFYMMSDQLNEEQATPLSTFFMQIVVLIFFLSGGFRQLVGAILTSYNIWPVESFLPRMDSKTIEFFLYQFGDYILLATVIAAPIVIASVLADYAMGLTNRFAPQMNIFMISMPVKSAICTVILFLYITFASAFLRHHILSTEAIINLVKGAIE